MTSATEPTNSSATATTTAKTTASTKSTTRLRMGVGGLGVLGILYGVDLVLTDQRDDHPIQLVKWLIGGVILHDGILVPATMLLGAVLGLVFKPRARRFVQGALISSGLVTVIALPLIYRHGKSQPGQALETQNYTQHLAIIVGLIAACALVAYGVRVLRDRQQSSAANVRPPDDQTSPTE